jgi:tRNA pseudouridine55 synthase
MTGFVCVDKAEGVSSAREVAILKKLTHTPCGHMGTLDPMASGVLPVAVGNAARLFDYFLAKKKKYRAEFLFGFDADTLDTTGHLVEEGEIPTAKQIEVVLPKFLGKIAQIPPQYSAKSVNGKRGYELARAGISFELQPKNVQIYAINLVEQRENNRFLFDIECGGGTYIRSLARDIAAALHTKAVMSALVRTASGPFLLENSVKTTTLTPDNVQNFLIPTESVLPYADIFVDDKQQKKLLNGVAVPTDQPNGMYKFYAPDGSFYGLAEALDGILKIRTKLC